MTSLSTEHTLIAAIPILVVLAVLSAAIIVFPKTNLDPSSRANEVNPSEALRKGGPTPIDLPTTTESLPTPYSFPSTSD